MNALTDILEIKLLKLKEKQQKTLITLLMMGLKHTLKKENAY